jgi:hypothetical protein
LHSAKLALRPQSPSLREGLRHPIGYFFTAATARRLRPLARRRLTIA